MIGMKSICKDITGQKFGRLLIVCRAKKPDGVKSKKAYWLCKCDCGRDVIVVGSSLRNTQTLSCGCLRNERVRLSRVKPFGHTARRALYLDYRYNATKRNLVFDLPYDVFIRLTSQNCTYCGIVPSQITKQGNAPGFYIYNGIDRVDSNIGYVESNCVPCCKKCNWAKMEYTTNEFLSWVKLVYNFNNLGSEEI